MNRLTRLLTLGALSLLAACSILPQTAPQQVYLLPGQAAPASPAKLVAWSLRVNTPQASQVLNSNAIAVVPQGSQISLYAASRWSDSAPRLLRNHLLNAFQSDGRIAALSSDDNNLHADLQLSGELQAFQTEYAQGRPRVVVRLHALLVDSRNPRILASQRFAVEQNLKDEQVPAVVAAFGQASDELAGQVLSWVMVQASQLPSQR